MATTAPSGTTDTRDKAHALLLKVCGEAFIAVLYMPELILLLPRECAHTQWLAALLATISPSSHAQADIRFQTLTNLKPLLELPGSKRWMHCVREEQHLRLQWWQWIKK
jgi:hypothetical protein